MHITTNKYIILSANFLILVMCLFTMVMWTIFAVGGSLWFFIFYVVLTLPYIILFKFLNKINRSSKNLMKVIAILVIMSVMSIYILLNAFILNPDPQAGIAIILMPVMQGFLLLGLIGSDKKSVGEKDA